ncbi:MAG: ketopantoate reductase C-terminal domain-containing protein, partial [Zestosphaera sp.]
SKAAALVLNHGVYRVRSHEFEWIGGSTSYLGSRGVSAELLKRISSLLKILSVNAVNDIEPYRWIKLSVNAAVNPLTALHGVKNKYIVMDENLFKAAVKVVEEVRDVAEKFNVRFYEDPLEEMVRVVKATGENYSSMCQDLMNGRRTEVDYINGEVVVRGKRVGVETPFNELLWLMIKFKESRGMKSGGVN